jgi:alkylated DNA repair dioxygenase AlkB
MRELLVIYVCAEIDGLFALRFGKRHQERIDCRMRQLEFFRNERALPDGLIYSGEFISRDEERQLVAAIGDLQFGEIKMHGVVAKRRAMHFGRRYEYESGRVGAAPPVPEFLLPLRERIADFTKCSPAEFVEALISEYAAGAGIGWHRDAPAFDFIVGISLLSECTMKFRQWPPVRAPQARKSVSLWLEPRSVYVLRGPVRTHWQHHIPSAKRLRYSITFRTMRGRQD